MSDKPITQDEFKALVFAYGDIPNIDRYLAVMKAYRAAAHFATLTQMDEDSNDWECSNCGGAWCLEDGTPQENEIHYCHSCGAYFDAIIPAVDPWKDGEE